MSEKQRQDLLEAEQGPGTNPAEDDYRSKFDDITGRPDMQALNDQGDAISRDHSRKEVNGKEKQAVSDTEAGKAAVAAANVAGSPIAGQAAKLLGKIRVNKGASGAITATIIVIFMLFSASILTTSLGPIAFFTNIMDDLNDSLPAMDKRSAAMLRTKVMTNAERQKFLKGCTTMSIRCKFKSISKRDEARFKRAGITVQGDSIAGRKFPTSYTMTIDGVETKLSAKELADKVSGKEPTEVKSKVRTALNMRSFGTKDKARSWVLRKLGVSQSAPKLTGNVDEDAKALAQGKSTITADTNVVVGVDEDGRPIVNGEAASSPASTEATKAIAAGAASGFKKGIASFAKAFNITGIADIACSVKNMIGYSVTASKYATGIKLVQHVQPIAALAFKIKAGEGTPHDAEVLGKVMNDTDTRETIADIGKTAQTYNEDPVDKEKPNPDQGKSVLDGNLSEMSALKSPPIVTEATQKYSLGISIASIAGILAFSATMMSAFGVDKTKCDLIQNWAARGAAFIVGVLAWFTGVGEANTAAILGFAAAAMGAFIILGIGLAVITNSSPVPDDIREKPMENSAAMWTGKAYLAGEDAKIRGLVPGTDEDIMAYSKELYATNVAYDAIEAEETAWYDTSSTNSIVSKAATTIGMIAKPSLSGSGTIASASSLMHSAATSVFDSQASAVAIDPARLKICQPDPDVDSYATASVIGGPIAVDVQCNVRYHMPAADLALDVDDVANYMEDNGHVVRDTLTGLPEGYELPPQDLAQSAATSFLKGTLKGFVDQFYSTRTYGTTAAAAEYGKYLDFCAYRSMPWGETFEESSGIGSAGPNWVNGKACMLKQGETIKDGNLGGTISGDMVSRFRIYTLDKVVNEASETGEMSGATNPSAAPVISGGGAAIAGSTAELAQKILDLEKAGKITLYTLRQEDVATRTTPKLQLTDIAAGKSPAVSVRCKYTAPSPINPDPKLLAFLADLGTQYPYLITALFGQCHTSAASDHHSGKAVDFGCPFNTTITDAVGKKYGVSRNGESCADAQPHYHYRTGG